MGTDIMRPVHATSTSVRAIGAAAALTLGIMGCDLLQVSNPGSLQDGQLADPALEQFVINGAIGEFQYAYVRYALYSAALTDEVFIDHANAVHRAFSLHNFDDANGNNELVFASLQRARQSAEDAAERVKTMRGDGAAFSVNVARALIFAAYSYVLLGEGFCEAPVNLSAPLPSDELLTRAIARFDEAIRVATAATTTSDSVAARDLIHLAHVGAARASLKKGDLAQARTYAANVPDTFVRMAYYSANTAREYNAVQDAVRDNLPWIAIHPVFQGRDDVRVPQPAAARPSVFAHLILPPLKPSMYSGWSATTPAPIDVATDIRFATGLEARYIMVEADGPTAAMLTFVNTRRAVAGKVPLNLSGSALVAEFRTQRALDFYLTGQRLGDLRRYALGGTDLFPTGAFPIPPGTYGNLRCFIVPQSEKARNPHY